MKVGLIHPLDAHKSIKKRRLFFLFLFFGILTFISFMPNSITTAKAAKIGGEFTRDGTMFLIYVPDYEGAGYVRQTIPYDTETLRTDTFRLYIILRSPYDRINVTVSVYYYKPDVPVENLTLKYRLEQEVYNGLNPAGNPFYADVEFNLKLANTTELISIQIKERLITFYHKTSEFEIPITMTTGEFIMHLGITAVITLVVFLFSGIMGMGLFKRTGYVPFFPSWMILLLFAVMEFGFIMSIMFDIQFDIEMLILSVWKNLLFMLLLPAFVIGAFFWGNLISRNSGNIKRVLLIGLPVREGTVHHIANEETVLHWKEKLYRLQVDAGIDSLRQFFMALLGKREEFKNYHSVSIPRLPESRKDFDEVIWLEDYEERKGELINFQKLGMYAFMPLAGGIGFLTLASIITVFIGSSIITSTLFSLAFLLIFVGILVIILDLKSHVKNTEIHLKPLKDVELVELFALRKDPIKELKRKNTKLQIALASSVLTDDLEKIVNLQSVIAAQDPEEILQYVSDLEKTLDEMDIPQEDVEYVNTSILVPNWEDIEVADVTEASEMGVATTGKGGRRARATSRTSR